MVLLLNRLNMAATRIIQNSAIMVVNGRTGQAGLLSNDLADKGVQRIIIFDPHKVVNNVTSPDGDYCRNCRHPVFDCQVCVIVYVNFCHGNTAFLFCNSLLQPWPKDLAGTTPLCVEVNQHGQFAFDDPVCEVIVVLNIERDFPAGGVRKAAR